MLVKNNDSIFMLQQFFWVNVENTSEVSTSWDYQSTTGNRNIKMHELGLSMRAIATRVGHDVTTIQRCVSRWM